MTTHFLSPLQWHLLLADSTKTPFHRHNTLYHALPHIPRFFHVWKTGPSMTASQNFAHFYWIKPWLLTF